MNKRAEPPALSIPPTHPRPTVVGRDREFLPAALEILETPPAPLPVALMMTICAFVAAAIAWAFVGELEVHAVAPGKIETVGHAKVIQPFEPGKVLAIYVENGARVKAGDLVLELDPAEAIADEKSAHDALDAGRAEVARRSFAIETVRSLQLLPAATEQPPGKEALGAALDQIASDTHRRITSGDGIPESFRNREEAVLSADLFQLSDILKSLDKQMSQKEATRQRVQMSIVFQDTLIKTLTDRVSTRQEAINFKVGTKINLYDAKEELEKSQSALASDQGQLIEADAALKELQSEKTKALSQFVADNENKMSDAARKTDEAKQALAKATARLSRTKLYAPIDGVVQQLAVTTVGQVVTTGQQLISVTPTEGSLQVEALVANMDIGFLKVGQQAAVKVDAFPFTRFGVLHGKVTRIASEAIDEQEAKRDMANATASANSANAATAPAPGQPDNFVFPVIIALEESSIKVGGAGISLTPGMTVVVEIKTDSRRVIDYLLSPLTRVASDAMKER